LITHVSCRQAIFADAAVIFKYAFIFDFDIIEIIYAITIIISSTPAALAASAATPATRCRLRHDAAIWTL